MEVLTSHKNMQLNGTQSMVSFDSIQLQAYVTEPFGTAKSTCFATLTCSEILSKILIRSVTWH